MSGASRYRDARENAGVEMSFFVGIDEAGYGPVLGPLVVAAAVFEVPGDGEPDLWRALAPHIARTETDGPDAVCIADSKRLHRGAGRLGRLERHVLATCPDLPLPARLRTLTRRLGVPDEHLAAGEPWYDREFPELPLAASLDRIEKLRARFTAGLNEVGGRLVSVRASLAQPWRFNRLVEVTHNKARTLWTLGAEAIERALGDLDGRRVHVTMDHQGGRVYYADLLRQTFLMSRVDVLDEGSGESRYRVRTGRHDMHLRFLEKADGLSLPVALASMYAKYVREVFMAEFNRWWAGRAEGVAPTAGYWTDYHRWAREMAPYLAALDLPEPQYVRSR